MFVEHQRKNCFFIVILIFMPNIFFNCIIEVGLCFFSVVALLEYFTLKFNFEFCGKNSREKMKIYFFH